MAERFPDFAERLKKSMKKARVSGGRLAKALDVRPQTVSAWRNGEYRPEGERLEQLAALLNVTPAWLAFGGEGTDGYPIAASAGKAVAERLVRADAFYDGILYSLATFNQASGELLAEVQRWRDSKRDANVGETAVAPETTRPVAVQKKLQASADLTKAKARASGEPVPKASPRPRRKQA